jgi:hypothetical protein
LQTLEAFSEQTKSPSSGSAGQDFLPIASSFNFGENLASLQVHFDKFPCPEGELVAVLKEIQFQEQRQTGEQGDDPSCELNSIFFHYRRALSSPLLLW